MVDFHSHILHGVDDGSQSLEESLKLLSMLSEQKVTHAVLTPHFIVDKDTPDSFLERRNAAFLELSSARPDTAPELLLGAEVAYYPGISRMSALPDMRIGTTELLLLEMPNEPWSNYTVSELVELSCSSQIKLMLAHVERCMFLQSKKNWRRLLESGIIMQSNASFFIMQKLRRKALRLYKRGMLHVIGSDCHNLQNRPPRLSEAAEVIEQGLGSEALAALNGFSRYLLGLK